MAAHACRPPTSQDATQQAPAKETDLDEIFPLRLARTASVLALMLAAGALAPAFAQDAAPAAEAPAAEAPRPVSPDTVVATVGGEPITEADLSFAAEDLTQELQPDASRTAQAVPAARADRHEGHGQGRPDAGMADTPLFQQRLNYLEDRALRRAYLRRDHRQCGDRGSRARRIRQVRRRLRAGRRNPRQPHPGADEEEAKAVKAELDGGADFATLAKEKSIDPGAANGGDLGFFGKGMMVAPFEAAAFALTDIGQVIEPVQSQFGWHVIRLEEKRQSAPPAFEQVAGQLQQQLLMKTFDDTVARLMEGVAIDIPDAALAARSPRRPKPTRRRKPRRSSLAKRVPPPSLPLIGGGTDRVWGAIQLQSRNKSLPLVRGRQVGVFLRGSNPRTICRATIRNCSGSRSIRPVSSRCQINPASMSAHSPTSISSASSPRAMPRWKISPDLYPPLGRVGAQRLRRRVIALRLGDDEAEHLARAGIAPMREDAGQEGKDIALDGAGIHVHLGRLLPVIDVEQQLAVLSGHHL